MSDRGVVRGTRRRSISESGPPRLSSTSIDDDLVFNDNDLSGARNNLSHQSQLIISSENPEGFIESPGLGLALDYKSENYLPIVI